MWKKAVYNYKRDLYRSFVNILTMEGTVVLSEGFSFEARKFTVEFMPFITTTSKRKMLYS